MSDFTRSVFQTNSVTKIDIDVKIDRSTSNTDTDTTAHTDTIRANKLLRRMADHVAGGGLPLVRKRVEQSYRPKSVALAWLTDLAPTLEKPHCAHDKDDESADKAACVAFGNNDAVTAVNFIMDRDECYDVAVRKGIGRNFKKIKLLNGNAGEAHDLSSDAEMRILVIAAPVVNTPMDHLMTFHATHVVCQGQPQAGKAGEHNFAYSCDEAKRRLWQHEPSDSRDEKSHAEWLARVHANGTMHVLKGGPNGECKVRLTQKVMDKLGLHEATRGAQYNVCQWLQSC